jgi:tubulin polyglutamylase TTLL5
LINGPPALYFGAQRTGGNPAGSELLYKIFNGDTKLIRSILEANNFQHTETHDWNLLWSSGNCKAYLYEGLNEYQKINHFPSSVEITRKDKLALNVRRMQQRFGKQHFDFLPDTYLIPDEFGEFVHHFNQLK